MYGIDTCNQCQYYQLTQRLHRERHRACAHSTKEHPSFWHSQLSERKRNSIITATKDLRYLCRFIHSIIHATRKTHTDLSYDLSACLVGWLAMCISHE
jgi:hypothetical protein